MFSTQGEVKKSMTWGRTSTPPQHVLDGPRNVRCRQRWRHQQCWKLAFLDFIPCCACAVTYLYTLLRPNFCLYTYGLKLTLAHEGPQLTFQPVNTSATRVQEVCFASTHTAQSMHAHTRSHTTAKYSIHILVRWAVHSACRRTVPTYSPIARRRTYSWCHCFCRTFSMACRASAFSFHTSPPSYTSFFQIGTVAFSSSMAHAHACMRPPSSPLLIHSSKCSAAMRQAWSVFTLPYTLHCIQTLRRAWWLVRADDMSTQQLRQAHCEKPRLCSTAKLHKSECEACLESSSGCIDAAALTLLILTLQ